MSQLSLTTSPVPDLWRAVQRHLNIEDDGDPQRQTVTAVWKALKMPLPTPPVSTPAVKTAPAPAVPGGNTSMALRLAAQITAEGRRFVNLREVRPNQDWDNPSTPGPDTALVQELRSLMRAAPWEPGWAYCAAFAEGIVALALERLGLDAAPFRAVMNPHCLTAWRAFEKRGLTSPVSVPGAIWLLRHGTTTQGHCALVTSSSHEKLSVSTIEGNTSKDAGGSEKDREGDWITTKERGVKGTGSLRTLGFIHPAHVLSLVGV